MESLTRTTSDVYLLRLIYWVSQHDVNARGSLMSPLLSTEDDNEWGIRQSMMDDLSTFEKSSSFHERFCLAFREEFRIGSTFSQKNVGNNGGVQTSCPRQLKEQRRSGSWWRVNRSDTTKGHLSCFLSIREHPRQRVEPKEQNNNNEIISDW